MTLVSYSRWPDTRICCKIHHQLEVTISHLKCWGYFLCSDYRLHLSSVFQIHTEEQRCLSTVKNRNTVCGKASTGKVIKMSSESSNYGSLEEKKSGILFLTLQSQSDNLCLAEKIMSQECSLITLWAASLCGLDRSRSPAPSTLPLPECCCFWGTHSPPLGEQSGTSPYECTAAAVTCRLNASAERLSGMRPYEKEWWDRLPVMVGSQWLWPLCNNFNCGAFSLSCGLYVNTAGENECGKIAIIKQVSPVSALYFPGWAHSLMWQVNWIK